MKKKWKRLVKINKTQSWFSETIIKTDKPLPTLIENKREKKQMNKIRNENREITDNTDIQKDKRLLWAIICQ